MPAYKWQNIQQRIKNIKHPMGAEIGVYRGEMSERLLANIPGLTLYMVDAWSPDLYNGKDDAASEAGKKNYIENYEDNFKAACVVRGKYPKRAKIIKLQSYPASMLINEGSLDFCFIDARHDQESVFIDIISWMPNVKRGGWICGHDYGGEFPGVKKAVDEIFGTKVEIESDYCWFVRIE